MGYAALTQFTSCIRAIGLWLVKLEKRLEMNMPGLMQNHRLAQTEAYRVYTGEGWFRRIRNR
jgi:hypothetical protein